MDSSKHVTEGLRCLVIDLSEQVVNNSISATILEPRNSQMDQGEREIGRKGIEHVEKQLKQVISIDLNANSKDILLIKNT